MKDLSHPIVVICSWMPCSTKAPPCQHGFRLHHYLPRDQVAGAAAFHNRRQALAFLEQSVGRYCTECCLRRFPPFLRFDHRKRVSAFPSRQLNQSSRFHSFFPFSFPLSIDLWGRCCYAASNQFVSLAHHTALPLQDGTDASWSASSDLKFPPVTT